MRLVKMRMAMRDALTLLLTAPLLMLAVVLTVAGALAVYAVIFAGLVMYVVPMAALRLPSNKNQKIGCG